MAEWAEIIKGAITNSLDGVHTSIPATVTGYLPLLQQCDVEPVIEGMPPLTDVPVCWPRGGGQMLHLPLEAGDTVMLMFSEQDFGPWRLAGSAQAPALLRRHGLFAVAIPGIVPDTAPALAPGVYSGAMLGSDAVGGHVVHVSSSGVECGQGPVFAQPVALAIPVQAIGGTLATLVTAAGVAAAAVVAPGDGGAAALATFTSTLATSLAAWPGPVASSVLKCSA